MNTLEESIKEEARLADLRGYQILDTLPEEAFDAITQLVAQICHVPVSLITLLDERRQWFKSHFGLHITETAKEYSFCVEAIRHADDILIIPDARKVARFSNNPLVTTEPNVVFYAGVPLVSPQGFSLGTLCAIDYKARRLSKEQIKSLKALAKQVVKLFELKKSHIELHQSEQRNRLLKENSIDAIFLLDEEGSILETNRAACQMLGYTQEKLTQLSIADLDRSNSRSDLRKYWQQHYENSTLLFETSYRHKNGSRIPVEVNSITFEKDGRKFQYYVGRDIANRKLAELALKASEEKFRLLFENMNAAFALHKIVTNEKGQAIDYTFIDVNPYFEKILGLSREAVINKNILDVLPNTEMHWIETYGKVALTGEPLKYVNYAREFDRYFETQVYSPQHMYFAVCFTDITEKLKAQKALHESEKRYKTFIESVTQGVYRFDLKEPLDTSMSVELQIRHLYKNAFLAECNKEFLSMYACTDESKMLGKSLTEMHGGDNVQKNIEGIKQFIMSGYKVMQQESLEPDQQGVLHHYANNAVGMLDENGYLIRVWGTQSDITKIKANEKELMLAKEKAEEKERLLQEKNDEIGRQNEVYQATNKELADSNRKIIEINKELQKANQELDNFVYRVSHDLRSPIASCLALVDLSLQEKNPLQLQEYLNMQQRSLRKQDKFIQDILNYSRNTRHEVAPERIDIKVMVEEIVNLSGHDYRNTNCSLEIVGESKIIGDEMRLQMILNNLISNAFKYSAYAENPVVIICIEITPKELLIKIKDNGIGIPKDCQSKVFDMFYRATTRSTGSGLGLYIVKEAVDKLKGSIALASEVGQGTSFIVKLPNYSIPCVCEKRSALSSTKKES